MFRLFVHVIKVIYALYVKTNMHLYNKIKNRGKEICLEEQTKLHHY